jgi:hypothetical protein
MGWHSDHGTTEAPFSPDVASRVNEYGGGAYRVADGWIVYSERSDDSVRLISPHGTVMRLHQGRGAARRQLDDARNRRGDGRHGILAPHRLDRSDEFITPVDDRVAAP